MDITQIIAKQRQFFDTGVTKELHFREAALAKLKKAIQSYERKILHALKQDLNKSDFDAFSTEIGVSLSEITLFQKKLPKWIKASKVKSPLTHIGSKSLVIPEPYGLALVIAPWNYPFYLAMAPLIGAIAAGNCVTLKPSEHTPNMSAIIADMIQSYFTPDHVAVVEGGVETSTSLLKEKFDYIFFTGSTAVGKIVMEAAAKHLTPVTLELGGKSPTIVHHDAKIPLAAKRIVWGKFLNAGQTCIAPDYLYVHRSVKDQLIQEMKRITLELYQENPLYNEQLVKIINTRHFERLVKLINPEKVIHGGNYDATKHLIEPTLLDHITWEDEVMQEEIFGPILPILTYDDINTAISEINQQSKPLALYIFSESKQIQDLIVERTSFGGGCINDTIMHVANSYLPFGGVGESGMGAYHGKGSFDTFSHYKSILKQTTSFDIPFRYPNKKSSLRWMRRFLK